MKRGEKIILLLYGVLALLFASNWQRLCAQAELDVPHFNKYRTGFGGEMTAIGLAAAITLSIWLRHWSERQFRVACLISVVCALGGFMPWVFFAFGLNWASFPPILYHLLGIFSTLWFLNIAYLGGLVFSLSTKEKRSIRVAWAAAVFISFTLGVLALFGLYQQQTFGTIFFTVYAVGNFVSLLPFFSARSAQKLGFCLHLGLFLWGFFEVLTKRSTVDSFWGVLTFMGALLAVLCFRVYDLQSEFGQKLMSDVAATKSPEPAAEQFSK